MKPAEFSQEEWEERLDNLPCSICNSNNDNDDGELLLCDMCNKGFHMYCLDPPIT